MSAETKIKGLIHKIQETQQISEKFKKRDIIINTGGDYPQLISVQYVNDAVFLLDDKLEGDHVELLVNIRGREWTSPQNEIKYFNTLQGWAINVVNDETPKVNAPVSNEMQTGIPKQALDENANSAEDDDLPF